MNPAASTSTDPTPETRFSSATRTIVRIHARGQDRNAHADAAYQGAPAIAARLINPGQSDRRHDHDESDEPANQRPDAYAGAFGFESVVDDVALSFGLSDLGCDVGCLHPFKGQLPILFPPQFLRSDVVASCFGFGFVGAHCRSTRAAAKAAAPSAAIWSSSACSSSSITDSARVSKLQPA